MVPAPPKTAAPVDGALEEALPTLVIDDISPGGDDHLPDRDRGTGIIPCFLDYLEHGGAAGNFHDQYGDGIDLALLKDFSEPLHIHRCIVKLGTAHHHHSTLDKIPVDIRIGDSCAVGGNQQVTILQELGCGRNEPDLDGPVGEGRT